MPRAPHSPLPALAFASVLLCGSLASAQATRHAPPPEPDPAQKLMEQADDIAGRVARIRGLPTLHPIAKGVKDRDMLRDALEARIAKEFDPAEIEGERALLVRLGLMPADLDYRRLIIDLLTEQIAGYYDTEQAELTLIEGLDPLLAAPAMAHEIFHAIQDQHFDLDRVQIPRRGLAGSTTNGDRALARAALVEGDATVLMLDYTFHEQGALAYGTGASFVDVPAFATLVQAMLTREGVEMVGAGPAMSRAPLILRQSLTFPYIAGLQFIVELRKNAAWSAINAIYLDPPDSTEQILHPDKYVQRDAPTLTTLDIAAIQQTIPSTAGPFVPIYENVMGELRIKLWLDQHTGPAGLGQDADGRNLSTARAAAGWDGDRFYVLRAGTRDVVVAAIVWDSPAEAGEAAIALHHLTANRYPAAEHRRAHGTFGGIECFTVGDQRIFIERWDDWLIYVEGFPAWQKDQASPPAEPLPTDIDPLRQAIWSSRRVGAYPRHAPDAPKAPAP